METALGIATFEVEAATVDAIVAGMDETGAAIVTDLLSVDDVASIRTELDAILDATPLGRNPFEGYKTRRIYNLFAKTRAFDGPATDSLVLGVLDRVLGPNYQFSAPVGICIGPGEEAQILHRDDSVYPLAWPHDEVVVNTMWAFDDFTAENGGTRVVPGSHRWESPHPEGDVETVHAEIPAGSVMFYRGSVLHGGGANLTDRSRLGVILEYVAAWLRPQENHVLGVPQDVVADLPRRLQELLGYNVYPPFLGYVDGVHPTRFL